MLIFLYYLGRLYILIHIRRVVLLNLYCLIVITFQGNSSTWKSVKILVHLLLEQGDIVRGDFVLGGYCPGGYCPGDIVRGDIVRGDIVLIPFQI